MIAEVIVKEDKQPKEVNKTYSLAQYFELEEQYTHKNEFVNRKIIPMAVGTFNHNILSSTIHGLLFMLLFQTKGKAMIFNSDQNIYLEKFNRIVYPDACIVEQEPNMQTDKKYGLTNPSIIIEVLSKSTEKYDRSSKFRLYQSLPSFKEYVLVNQEAPIIEVFLKIEENKWQMTSYIGMDKVIALETLGVELKMSDIYKNAKDLKDPQLVFDME